METSKTTATMTTTTMQKTRMSTRSLALRSSLPRLPRNRPQRSSKVPSPLLPQLQVVKRRQNHNQSSKNTAASGVSSLHPRWRLQAKRKPLVSDESSAMHTAYTTPGELSSFGGARRPFVGTLFDRRDAQHYLRTRDAYTLHRQARRRFPRRETLERNCRPLPGRSRRPVKSVELQQLVSLSVDVHRCLYQASLGDTNAQENRQGSDGCISKDTRNVRAQSENVADRQGYGISECDVSTHASRQ